MERRCIHALLGAMVWLVVFGGAVNAVERVSATLDGTEITLARAGDLSCHDFDYPVIRCFQTPAAMNVDVARRLQKLAASGGGLAVAVGYVIIYEHATYSGATMALSADQPWLSSIGWNDRISSFKSIGATGRFRENSPASGFAYNFGPTTQVPTLSDTYNDKFSAFDIN